MNLFPFMLVYKAAFSHKEENNKYLVEELFISI